jgi:hypothetical protein
MITAAVVAGAAVFTPAAMAATSTISATDNTSQAEQAVPVDLTFSGTNGTGSSAHVDAVVRPAGGLACQSSYQEDLSTLGTQDTTIVAPVTDNAPAGPYSVAANYKPPASGSYQVCAWLQQTQGGSDQVVPGVPPATVSFTARGPQVTVLTVAPAKPLTPDVPFQIAYTTQTDQPLSLYSTITGSTAGQACPASWELQQQQNQAWTSLLGNGATVFGGPTTTTAATKQKQGTYLICTWVEGPNPAEVDAAATTPITVGTPSSTLPPKPGLKLGKITASRRHGITVAGTTTSKFTGRVVIAAACGRATSTGSANAKRGRFSGRVGLPGGCRRAHTVKLTVSWNGSKTWTKQSVAKAVAIKS